MLTFFVFLPYLYPLILAATIAVVFQPLFRSLIRVFGGSRTIAAFFTVCVVAVIVIVPLVFFGFQVASEAQSLYGKLSNPDSKVFNEDGVLAAIQYKISEISPESISLVDAEGYVRKGLSWLIENVGNIFSSIFSVIVGFLIMLLALFFLFRDGEKLRKALFEYSPLEDHYDEEIYQAVSGTASSVIKGTLVISIIQGILAGIGFWIFGVPNPALWGLMTVVAALVPVFGTLLTLVPAVIYLLVNGSFLFALGLFLWGVLVVSTVDNFLRPKIIGRRTHIHSFVVFLSVLGGIQFFGAMGFLIGPLVVGFLFSLLKIYSELESGKKNNHVPVTE